MSDWQQDAEILRLCLDVDKLPLDAESAVRGQHALDRIAAYIEELELRDNRLEAAEAETRARGLPAG